MKGSGEGAPSVEVLGEIFEILHAKILYIVVLFDVVNWLNWGGAKDALPQYFLLLGQ